jgi:uncharacterized protein (TIGR03435 family)
LIRWGYNVRPVQIVGGPSALMSRSFEINAKAANPDATAAQMTEMLKSLLVERFKLKTRTEIREVDISLLKLARGDGRLGPNLKPSALSCPTFEERATLINEAMAKGDIALKSLKKPDDPCLSNPLSVDRSHVRGQPISVILNLLSTQERPFVEDRTGLKGRYDWDLTYDPRPLSVSVDDSSPTGPPLLTALEQQLGLKAEKGKGRVAFLVIESAESPTPD